MGYFTKVCL
uniref:Uncharacterized protein n=1 Tax=Arundo donax TaxID=35708 RepID=A0A0A9BXG4_ARUDO